MGPLHGPEAFEELDQRPRRVEGEGAGGNEEGVELGMELEGGAADSFHLGPEGRLVGSDLSVVGHGHEEVVAWIVHIDNVAVPTFRAHALLGGGMERAPEDFFPE